MKNNKAEQDFDFDLFWRCAGDVLNDIDIYMCPRNGKLYYIDVYPDRDDPFLICENIPNSLEEALSVKVFTYFERKDQVIKEISDEYHKFKQNGK